MYASLSGTRIYFGVEGMGNVIGSLCSGFSGQGHSSVYKLENNEAEQFHRITAPALNRTGRHDIIIEEYKLIETVSSSGNSRPVSGDKS
ncbi:hypothetical protein [Brevibacillus reuszeri]|uniref:hypothetical protein n=1 Tax=Brevibacillus reuszeri TaxID=54915 RepID=UPI00289B1A15|nr:hypothetical protein [Brevibacillus reuszeri]